MVQEIWNHPSICKEGLKKKVTKNTSLHWVSWSTQEAYPDYKNSVLPLYWYVWFAAASEVTVRNNNPVLQV